MRSFFKEGSTVSEITSEVNKYKTGTYQMSMATTDALYIASDFPFNHLYVKLGTVVNLISSALTIEYWSNDAWVSVVNTDDDTGALSASGFVEFTPDRDKNWSMDHSYYADRGVTDLSSIVVYDKYWVKIYPTVTMTNSIDLQFIGNIFSDDYDLFAEYPIFNDSNFMTGFEAAKTSWQEQHVKAADLIIQDMKRKGIVIGKEQILDRSVLMPAAVCKTAEIIFNSFGNDYNDQKLAARNEYDKRMDLSRFVVDENNNGIKDPEEIKTAQGWLSR